MPPRIACLGRDHHRSRQCSKCRNFIGLLISLFSYYLGVCEAKNKLVATERLGNSEGSWSRQRALVPLKSDDGGGPMAGLPRCRRRVEVLTPGSPTEVSLSECQGQDLFSPRGILSGKLREDQGLTWIGSLSHFALQSLLNVNLRGFSGLSPEKSSLERDVMLGWGSLHMSFIDQTPIWGCGSF